MSVEDFYDGLAAEYHLIFEDWDVAVLRQGAVLDALIREAQAIAGVDVLDCSCGIGTQAIGLAASGYRVHGTDISQRSIERARVEAARLGQRVSFDVADFRDLDSVEGEFDVVLSCDNAVPHLQTDEDIGIALRAMGRKLRPRGLLVISIRDYDKALVERPATTSRLLLGPPRRLDLRFYDWERRSANPHHSHLPAHRDRARLGHQPPRHALPSVDPGFADERRGGCRVRRRRVARRRRHRLQPADHDRPARQLSRATASRLANRRRRSIGLLKGGRAKTERCPGCKTLPAAVLTRGQAARTCSAYDSSMQSFMRTTTFSPGRKVKTLNVSTGCRPVGTADAEADGYPLALLDHLAEGEAASVLVMLFETSDDLLPVLALVGLPPSPAPPGTPIHFASAANSVLSGARSPLP